MISWDIPSCHFSYHLHNQYSIIWYFLTAPWWYDLIYIYILHILSHTNYCSFCFRPTDLQLDELGSILAVRAPGSGRPDPGLRKLCWAHGGSAQRRQRQQRTTPGGSSVGAAESLEGPGIWDSDPLLWKRPWADSAGKSLTYLNGYKWRFIAGKIIWLTVNGWVSSKPCLIAGG